MDILPGSYAENFKRSYQKASNRLVKEFTNTFCNEDGSIGWEKLVNFCSDNSRRNGKGDGTQNRRPFCLLLHIRILTCPAPLLSLTKTLPDGMGRL